MTMVSRLALILITLFWVTMNVLLWRSEFGQRNPVGSLVPPELVWHKVLTAPDDSSLEIVHHGKKIGYCHWMANVGKEQATGKTMDEDLQPEGLVEQLTGYGVDLDGGVTVGDLPNRLRFNLDMRFTTNHVWQEFNARFTLRPNAWEIHAAAVQQTLQLKIEDGRSQFEHIFSFADLQNPQALLREFAGPFPLTLLGTVGLPSGSGRISAAALGLTWEARNDWIKVGHTPVRAYRLWARVLDQFQVAVFVSRVGEILRVELPDELLLINDELTGL